MRASSLSHQHVIELLSRYFVPVYLAKDDSRDLQPSQSDREEVTRISRECRERKLDAGSVCVYLIRPSGEVLATLLVQKASKPENLIPLLQQIIKQEKVVARDPKTAKAVAFRSAVPLPPEGGVRLHVMTRFEGNRANYGLSEDWVALTADEVQSFLPQEGMKQGASWSIPEKVVEKLYRYFYPPGPNWDTRQSKVLKASLTATAGATTAQGTEIRLRGGVELTYPFAGVGTEGKVTAKLVGLARVQSPQRQLTAFTLVTEEALFVWNWEGKPQPEKMAIAVELEAR